MSESFPTTIEELDTVYRRAEAVSTSSPKVNVSIISLEDILSQTVRITYEQEKTDKVGITRVSITCKDNTNFLKLVNYLTDDGATYSITTVDGKHKVTVID